MSAPSLLYSSPTLPTTDDVRANGHFSTKWLHDHKKNTQCFCPQGFIFLQWMAPAFCWTVQIMVRLKTYCQADFSDKSSPAPAGTSTSTTQQTKLLTQQSFAESGGNLHWLREKLFKLSKKKSLNIFHWTFVVKFFLDATLIFYVGNFDYQNHENVGIIHFTEQWQCPPIVTSMNIEHQYSVMTSTILISTPKGIACVSNSTCYQQGDDAICQLLWILWILMYRVFI